MELFLSLTGAVTVSCAVMYAVIRLGAFCDGREW